MTEDQLCPCCGAPLFEAGWHRWCAAEPDGVLCRHGIRPIVPGSSEARTGIKGALAGFAGDLEREAGIVVAPPAAGSSLDNGRRCGSP